MHASEQQGRHFLGHWFHAVVYIIRGVALHNGNSAAWHVHFVMELLRLHAVALEAEREDLPREEAERNNGPLEQVWRVKVVQQFTAFLVIDVEDRRVCPFVLEDAALHQNRRKADAIGLVDPSRYVVALLSDEGLGAFASLARQAWRQWLCVTVTALRRLLITVGVLGEEVLRAGPFLFLVSDRVRGLTSRVFASHGSSSAIMSST